MSNTPNLQTNPLVNPPKTKHDVPPLDVVKEKHFIPAFDWAIEKAHKGYEKIKKVKNPTFGSVIEAMEHVADDLDRVSAVYSNFKSNLYTDEMDAIADAVSKKLTHFSSDIMLDEDLFKQVEAVYNKRDTLGLDEDQMMLLEDTYKGFVRSGAKLGTADKKTLRDINEKLSQAGTDFGRNIQKYMTTFEHVVEDVADLDGLPQRVIDAAAHAAEEAIPAAGKKAAAEVMAKAIENIDDEAAQKAAMKAAEPEAEKASKAAIAKAKKKFTGNYLFTVQPTSVMPVLQYAKNRSLRETMWKASAHQAMQPGMDNRPVIKDIVTLRDKKAKLLGYGNYAEFVLEERMAGNVAEVTKMLDYFKQSSEAPARQEFDELMDYIKLKKGPADPKPWDMSFYIEQMRQEKYKFDSEELRPYFSFEKAQRGAFGTAEKMYDISITESKDYPTYEKGVFTYEVTDNKSGELLGILYTDYFPRETKRPGAWENTYRKGGQDANGDRIIPVVGVHGSLTPPTPGKPSLLSYDEVNTMFHEFGHSLHDLLTQARYKSQAGTNVKWDFVELPSQIMENWLKEKDVLDTFAEHYQTGDKIPAALLKKMKDAELFRSGTGFFRQIELGVLDMAYHTTDPSKIADPVDFEHKALKDFHFVKPEPGSNISTRFGHLFAGGYAAGYYSYKWAEILEADAFESFKQDGLFNQKTAAKFRKLLEQGGSRDPQKLYEEFKGRKQDPDALLRREGLLPKKPANSNKPAPRKTARRFNKLAM